MKNSIRRSAVLVAVLTLSSITADAETLEDTIEKTLPFAAGSLLQLSNTNGDVEITTWDRAEIQIKARKKVKSSNSDRARQAFEDLKVTINESSTGVTIETEYPKGKGSWWGGNSASVNYYVQVPAEADLEIDTVNGKVEIEKVHGQLDLESTNGGVKVREAGGSVTARTTNGGIDVELRQVEVDENMDFRTTNGSITLALPAGVQANLTARTTNGSVQTDFPITIQGSFRKNRLDGEINGGGASIDLKTTNGSIRIREF